MEKRSKARKSKSKKPTQVISFTSFFNDCVRRGVLSETQKEAVQLFFRESGLKPNEDLKIYQEMLKRY